MKGFDKDFVLDRIAETEDLEHSAADVFDVREMPENTPEEMKGLLRLTGKVVGMDYADLGEDSYDAYGVFCFLPDVEEDPCRYLTIMFTLTDQVNDLGIADMYQIINRINTRITEGAFVLSEDETTLSYRNNVPIFIDTDDETALRVAGTRVLDALATVASWIDVLMGLNDGNLTYEECLESTKAVEEV